MLEAARSQALASSQARGRGRGQGAAQASMYHQPSAGLNMPFTHLHTPEI